MEGRWTDYEVRSGVFDRERRGYRGVFRAASTNTPDLTQHSIDDLVVRTRPLLGWLHRSWWCDMHAQGREVDRLIKGGCAAGHAMEGMRGGANE